MEVLIVVSIFISMLVFAFLLYLPTIRKHKKTTKKIVNHDPFLQKFVYKVFLSKDEITTRLQTHNVTDELEYIFDLHESMITFTEYGAKMAYLFRIDECNGFCILHLHHLDINQMHQNQLIPMLINPFMIKKLHAEIIPYSLYKIEHSAPS